MKKMYVMKMADNWNEDFCVVADNMDTIADCIYEICAEEYIFPENVKEQMEQREKENYVYLLDNDSIPEHWGLNVMAVPLNRGIR